MAWKSSVFLQGVRGVRLRPRGDSVQGHVPARVWGFESPLRHHAALNGHRSECTRWVQLSSGVFREYCSPLRRRVRTCLRPRHPLQERTAVSARPIRDVARLHAEQHLGARMPQLRRYPGRCGSGAGSACRRRSRAPGPDTGRVRPRCSWACPRSASCAGRPAASSVASVPTPGRRTATMLSMNCAACSEN